MVLTPAGDPGCITSKAAYDLGAEEAEEVGNDENENDRADDVDDVALAHGWFLLVVLGRPSCRSRSWRIIAWNMWPWAPARGRYTIDTAIEAALPRVS